VADNFCAWFVIRMANGEDDASWGAGALLVCVAALLWGITNPFIARGEHLHLAYDAAV
jgi:hypothetical protein